MHWWRGFKSYLYLIVQDQKSLHNPTNDKKIEVEFLKNCEDIPDVFFC